MTLMISKETAVILRAHGLNAIRELNSALSASQKIADEKEAHIIKQSIGDVIARIDHLLASAVYAKFPDLDDLAG